MYIGQRHFNGKLYVPHRNYKRKSDAIKAGKRARKRGVGKWSDSETLARVIKTKNGWTLYVSPYKKKRRTKK